jgi:hypothetical protein
VPSAGQAAGSGRNPANARPHAGNNGAAKNGKDGLYRSELLDQVKALCDKVGFSLSKSVLKAVAKAEDPERISDMAKLTAAFEKLEDTERGVERLRSVVAKVGAIRHAELCRELNLASEAIDDIPDRSTLRRLVETLESEAPNGENGATSGVHSNGTAVLSELRGRLLHEASRASGITRRSLADVINEAAKGSFTLATLKRLGQADTDRLQAALAELQRMAARHDVESSEPAKTRSRFGRADGFR